MTDKSIYIVFSKTTTAMGSFIRKMTKSEYNHVSVALNPDLSVMYSFARRHVNTPFDGGFVTESPTRFRGPRGISKVKVCRIRTNENRYHAVLSHIEKMRSDPGGYGYNFVSAVALPWRKRLISQNRRTCSEFAQDIMAISGEDVRVRGTYSIKDLEKIVADRVIYEGDFPNACRTENSEIDIFDVKIGFLRGSYLSLLCVFGSIWEAITKYI